MSTSIAYTPTPSDTLTIQVISPDPTGPGGVLIQNNFEAIADKLASSSSSGGVANPMTSNLDAGGKDIINIGTNGDNPALAVAGATSLDGGQISTDGSGDLTVNGTLFVGQTLSVVSGTSLDGGAIATDGSGDLTVHGTLFVGQTLSVVSGTSLDGGAITTDGSGTLTLGNAGNLNVSGKTSLDNGRITTDGSGTLTLSNVLLPVQTETSSAPSYVLGGLYFDTTLNKLRVGGASGWETVTSV